MMMHGLANFKFKKSGNNFFHDCNKIYHLKLNQICSNLSQQNFHLFIKCPVIQCKVTQNTPLIHKHNN